MRKSVVWYSQRITDAIGDAKLSEYLRGFRFGNADISGDRNVPGPRYPAWIDSSLRISPAEQAEFFSRLVTKDLPVSADAMKQATALLEQHVSGGWTIRGKTGTSLPRDGSGRPDVSRGLGWYVGWAEKEGRVLAFAR
ncbi:penicillin-binding transpeptidase domain-containing protein, partial [Streptococcus pyogenes]|uniref:penicillin-binding transpeptidase domain-containing protein n=1 Tax=Streptococcus pyogenes TaxID=1314 RepID=UPI003DA1385B